MLLGSIWESANLLCMGYIINRGLFDIVSLIFFGNSTSAFNSNHYRRRNVLKVDNAKLKVSKSNKKSFSNELISLEPRQRAKSAFSFYIITQFNIKKLVTNYFLYNNWKGEEIN